jgi:hypothetical protein
MGEICDSIAAFPIILLSEPTGELISFSQNERTKGKQGQGNLRQNSRADSETVEGKSIRMGRSCRSGAKFYPSSRCSTEGNQVFSLMY